MHRRKYHQKSPIKINNNINEELRKLGAPKKIELIHKIVFQQSNSQYKLTNEDFKWTINSLTTNHRLYRYRSASDINRLLEEILLQNRDITEKYSKSQLSKLNKIHSLWCSYPESFNDPYDTWFYSSLDSYPIFQTTAIEDFCDFFKKHNKNDYKIKNVENNIDTFKMKCLDAQSNTNWLKYLKEYSSQCYDDLFKKEIQPNFHYSLIEKSVDEFRKKFQTEHIMNNEICNKLGVACFTTRYNSLLMWSHYADSHKGYCLEYKCEDIPGYLPKMINLKENNDVEYNYKNKNLLVPVRYYDEMVPLWQELTKKGESINDLTVKECCARKALDWSYEREWRLIAELKSKSDRKIKLNPPSAIYLGAHISPINEVKLKICGEIFNIPVKKMVLESNRFILGVITIQNSK